MGEDVNANSDDLMVALPSDKKGRKPLIACSVEEVPILADAIEAVLSIRQHRIMQLKSEGLLVAACEEASLAGTQGGDQSHTRR